MLGKGWTSASESGNCVRVRVADDRVLVGDTKNPDGPVLEFTLIEWATFLEGARRTKLFDLPEGAV